MTNEELISTIKSLVNEYGGFKSLTLYCGNYSSIRYNNKLNKYEIKWSPCWDIEIWEELDRLDRNTLEKICESIDFR